MHMAEVVDGHVPRADVCRPVSDRASEQMKHRGKELCLLGRSRAGAGDVRSPVLRRGDGVGPVSVREMLPSAVSGVASNHATHPNGNHLLGGRLRWFAHASPTRER